MARHDDGNTTVSAVCVALNMKSNINFPNDVNPEHIHLATVVGTVGFRLFFLLRR